MQPSFKKPLQLFNRHLETIYPSLFRSVPLKPSRKERINTPDNDFLDLVWNDEAPSKKLLIICHGLEGDAHRPYMQGMALRFIEEGFNTLRWAYRGCSGEMNRTVRCYHSGATDDLETVIKHALSAGAYTELFLLGFSLGGNLVLKFVGEKSTYSPKELKAAVAVSTPLDLAEGAKELNKFTNYLYEQRFLKTLKEKMLEKEKRFPGSYNIKKMVKATSLEEFDDAITAPVHGFKDAADYYEKNGSINFLSGITIPTLILNAENDPFFGPKSKQHQRFNNHSCITFALPPKGGHVGFQQKDGKFFSEEEAVKFCLDQSSEK